MLRRVRDDATAFCGSKQVFELGDGQARILDDPAQCAGFQIAIVERHGDAKGGILLVAENMVAARDVMHDETGLLQGRDQLARRERRKLSHHATSGKATVSGLKSAPRSSGIGRPSLRRLSR